MSAYIIVFFQQNMLNAVIQSTEDNVPFEACECRILIVVVENSLIEK